MIRFWQKVTATERKKIAAVISEITGQPIKYTGVPTHAYEIGGWRVDRLGKLHSPEIEYENIEEFEPVLKALATAGLSVVGDLFVAIGMEEQLDSTLNNLRSQVTGKANLLSKSLNHPIEQDSIVASDTDITVNFFNATLNFDEIKACILLAEKLIHQAETLKYCFAKEKVVENEKYALRCFLLRLGFIGRMYKTQRKILLKNLTGNSSFKNGTESDEEVAQC